MKKKFLILMVCILSIGLVACSSNSKNTNKNSVTTIKKNTETINSSEEITNSSNATEESKKTQTTIKEQNSSTTENSKNPEESSSTTTESSTSTKTPTETKSPEKESVSSIETPSPTEEPTPAPTKTPSPTEEPTPAPTETPSPTEEPTPAPTETPSSTEEPTPTPTETPSPTEEPTPAPTETPSPTEEPIEITYTPLNEVEDEAINNAFCYAGSVLNADYLPKMSMYQQLIESTYNIPKNSIEYAYGEVPFLPTSVDFLIGIKAMDGNEELVENAAKDYVKLLINDSEQTAETLEKYKTIQVYRNDRYVFIIGTFGNTSNDSNLNKIKETSTENVNKALEAIKKSF